MTLCCWTRETQAGAELEVPSQVTFRVVGHTMQAAEKELSPPLLSCGVCVPYYYHAG